MPLHRLHIGGLGPGITEASLRQLLGSFGEVVGFDGLGKLDANGVPLRYAFVEFEASDAQAQRCMSLLSGTTYKGCTLRIAPARPDYRGRLEREWAGLQTKATIEENPEGDDEEGEGTDVEESDSHERCEGPEVYEHGDMVLMTKERLDEVGPRSGWKKDPTTGLPIFPIIARPLRPLPARSDPPSTVSRPPNRAFRVRIDPTQYAPASLKGGPLRKRHLVGTRDIVSEMYKLGYAGKAKGFEGKAAHNREWVCEEGSGGEVVWRLNGGELEERVQLQMRQSAERPRKSAPPKRRRSASPIATNPIPSHLRHPSSAISARNGEDIQAVLADERRSHLSLLDSIFASRSTDDDVVLEDVGSGSRAAVERQRAREGQLDTGITWMADAGIAVVKSTEDAGGKETAGKVLRLRGGAGSDDDNDDDDEEEEEEEDDDDDSDSSSDASSSASRPPGQVPVAGSAASSVTLNGKALASVSPERAPQARHGNVAMVSLTSMFRAQPEASRGGFLLFGDSMDFEMGEDPLADFEVPEGAAEPGRDVPMHPSRMAALAGPSTVPMTSTSRPRAPPVPADQDSLFFPYPFDDEEYEPGGMLHKLGIVKGDARDEALRSRCRFHAVPEGQQLSGWRTFFSADNLEGVTKAHDEAKVELTRGIKRRKKEAVKSARAQRRKGVAAP